MAKKASVAPLNPEAAIAAMQGKRVTVIGDAMLDVYVTGDAERLSPEAPVPVLRERARREVLGGAANVAANLTALGVDPELVTVLGADTSGETIVRLLGPIRGRHRSIVHASRPTTTKTRIVAAGQHIVRVDVETEAPVAGPKEDQLLEAINAALGESDGVILQDYGKGVITPRVIRFTIETATERGIPVVVDPKSSHLAHYRGATVFKPNARELSRFVGGDVAHTDGAQLEAIRERLAVRYLLVTYGAHGMVLVGAEGVLHLPTAAREVFDVVGAGDTVASTVAAALAAGLSAADAARLATAAAGVAVSKRGTATVSAGELAQAAGVASLKASGR